MKRKFSFGPRVEPGLEVVVDLHQWLLGFNFYAGVDWGLWNVFVGPVRIGWMWGRP